MNFSKLNGLKIIIVLAALGIPAGYSWYLVQGYKGEIKQLKQSVSNKDESIKEKDITISSHENEIKELKGKLGDLEQVNKTLGEIQKSREAAQATEKIIDANVATINQKYQTLPKSDANEQARKREISRERVKGLWLSYCIAHPENLRCKDEK